MLVGLELLGIFLGLFLNAVSVRVDTLAKHDS